MATRWSAVFLLMSATGVATLSNASGSVRVTPHNMAEHGFAISAAFSKATLPKEATHLVGLGKSVTVELSFEPEGKTIAEIDQICLSIGMLVNVPVEADRDPKTNVFIGTRFDISEDLIGEAKLLLRRFSVSEETQEMVIRYYIIDLQSFRPESYTTPNQPME